MTSPAELAAIVEASGFGSWAQGSAYAYPAANLLHLLGLVMLVGAIGIVDIRLAGAFRVLPLDHLSRLLTPVALAGLLLMIGSGSVMFAADARALAGSPVLRWKLALIVLALANAVAFRLLSRRRLKAWGERIPPAARAAAVASLALWLAAAALGRLIAYL